MASLLVYCAISILYP